MRISLRTTVKALACVAFLLGAPKAVLAQCSQTLGAGDNIVSAVANAPNNSTICLNNGTYGTVSFSNITRSGFVTLRSASGRGATISPRVGGSRYIRFSNLTVSSMTVNGCSTNIELVDSTMSPNTTGLAFNYDSQCSGIDDMQLVVDGVTFHQVRTATYEGRLSLRGVRGVTIKNSVFSGQPSSGQSDGIFIGGGSRNVTIGPGNIFRDILQNQCGGVHCDSIQGYGGGENTVITGNYFINCTVYIGFYDGGSPNMTISHNVFDTGTSGQNLQIGGIHGMRMEHNTFRGVTLGIGTKYANSPHSGWVVQNNIFDNARFTASGDQPGCGSDCIMRYNLKSRGGSTNPSGSNNITGDAIYVGSGSPSNWGNWQLASGSPGKNAGNDGRDMGTNFYGSGEDSVSPPAAPKNLTIKQ